MVATVAIVYMKASPGRLLFDFILLGFPPMDEQDPPRLPTELLHQIVDIVAEQKDANSILVAITQASRVMRPRANEHLFETVDINIDRTDTLDRLRQSYTANPSLLAKYPKNLNILGIGDPTDLLDEPFFATIVSHMQNLRRVSVVDCEIVDCPFIYAFAAHTKHQITHLELKRIDLTYDEFATFLSSPCLTHLSLGGLIIAEYPTMSIEDGVDFSSPNCSLPQPQSALKRPLRELRLDLFEASDALIMDLIATSRYPIIAEDSLVKVGFTGDGCTDQEVDRLQRLLDCKAVKSADILWLGDCDDYISEADNSLGSSECQPLMFGTFKSVEFVLNLSEGQTPKLEFQWWTNSLRAVPLGSSLKELLFRITFRRLAYDLLDVAPTEWEDFDDALCGRNLALEHLSIVIVLMHRVNAQIEESVREWFLACLPRACEEYFDKGVGKITVLYDPLVSSLGVSEISAIPLPVIP